MILTEYTMILVGVMTTDGTKLLIKSPLGRASQDPILTDTSLYYRTSYMTVIFYFIVHYFIVFGLIV